MYLSKFKNVFVQISKFNSPIFKMSSVFPAVVVPTSLTLVTSDVTCWRRNTAVASVLQTTDHICQRLMVWRKPHWSKIEKTTMVKDWENHIDQRLRKPHWSKIDGKPPASPDVDQGCTSLPPPGWSPTRPSPSPTPSSCPPTLPSCLTTSMHSFTAKVCSTCQQTIWDQDGNWEWADDITVSALPCHWAVLWIVDLDPTGSKDGPGCLVDAHGPDGGGRLRGADPTPSLPIAAPHSLPRPSAALHCTNARCIIAGGRGGGRFTYNITRGTTDPGYRVFNLSYLSS